MKHKVYIFMLIIFLILTIIFFNNIVFTNLTYFQRDVMLQFKPWRIYVNRTLENITKPASNYLDFIPLWNPYNYCGAPLFANLQSQVFYPLSIVFILIKDFVIAYKVFIIIHFFLSLVFMFTLLWSKKLNLYSCIAGSIIWAFNGFMVSRIEFLSLFTTIIWLPIIIFMFSLACKKFEFKKIIFLSLLLSLQFFAGHTQMWFYTITFLMFYSIFKSYEQKLISPIVSCFLSIILSILISAVLFLPATEFILYSVRAGEETITNISRFGLSYDKVTLGSLSIKDLLNFVFPFYWKFDFVNLQHNLYYLELSYYWLYTFYIGFVGLTLAIIGFITIKNLKEKIFYIITTILAILFSLGKNSVFFKLLSDLFPVIRIFRYPSTAVYVIIFILSLMSAYGMQFLCPYLKKKKWLRLVCLLLPLICFIELYIYNLKITMLLPKSILYEKGETINFLIQKNIEDNYRYRFAHTPLTQKLAITTKGESLYSVFLKYRDKLFSNINLEYGLFNFSGQDIVLKNYHKFTDFVYKMNTIDEALPFFAIANTKYILSIIPQNSKNLKLIKDGVIKIYENLLVKQKIYFVTNVIAEPNIDKALQLMKKLGNKLLNCAILHTNDIPFVLTRQNNQCEIQTIKFTSNKIHIKLTSDTKGVLVISQNYYPGWKCKINNLQETKIYPCNIFMSCIVLPTPTNEILFYYDPLSFKIGCILTLTTILFILLYLFEERQLQ